MTITNLLTSSINDDILAFQASPDDEMMIRELHLQTAKWLNSMGSTQWGGLLHGQDDHNLAGAITRGEVFVFRKAGEKEIAGSVILQQQPSDWDRNLWGEEKVNKGNAVYLHRLIVNRHYSGQGLGSQIMEWTINGIRFAGKDRINLDCIANNEKLNLFYKTCGFTYMGETNEFSKYEKLIHENKQFI